MAVFCSLWNQEVFSYDMSKLITSCTTYSPIASFDISHGEICGTKLSTDDISFSLLLTLINVPGCVIIYIWKKKNSLVSYLDISWKFPY